jgi:hypothetical protein
LIAYRFVLLHRILRGEDWSDRHHLECTFQGIYTSASELFAKRIPFGIRSRIEMLTDPFERRLGIW